MSASEQTSASELEPGYYHVILEQHHRRPSTDQQRTPEEILIRYLADAGCLEKKDIEERKDEPWFIASVEAMEEYKNQECFYIHKENERLKLKEQQFVNAISELTQLIERIHNEQ